MFKQIYLAVHEMWFLYLQNIDSLERIAGIPTEKIVEAHGTFFTAHCLDCRKEYSLDHIQS